MPDAKLLDFTGDPVVDGAILLVGTVTVLIAFTWRDLITMIMQRYFADRIFPRIVLALIMTLLGYLFIRWCVSRMDDKDDKKKK